MHLPLLLKKWTACYYIILLFLLSCPLSAGAQNFEWAIQTGSRSFYYDVGRNMVCADPEGNVFVAGIFEDSVDFDPSPNTALLAPLVKRDEAIFLAKYDANGKYLWAKCISSSFNSLVWGLNVDRSGRVTVCGDIDGMTLFNGHEGIDTLKGSNTMWPMGAIFIAQYDKDGNFLWVTLAKDTSGNSQDPSTVSASGGLDVDKYGNVYACGLYSGTIDFDPGNRAARSSSVSSFVGNNANAFVAKYDTTGRCVWVRSLEGSANLLSGHSEAFGVVADSLHDDIYLTGYFEGSVDFDPGVGVYDVTSNMSGNSGADVFIIKLDGTGRYQWAKAMGGSNIDHSRGITLDGRGSIYISGFSYSSDADFDPGPGTAILQRSGSIDMFIARYDMEGNYCWVKGIGGNGAEAAAESIKADEYGNVYITGIFGSAPVDFDPGTSSAIITPSYRGYRDGFIAQYDACGNYDWASNIDIGGYAYPTGIFAVPASDNTCDVYAVGMFTGSNDFNPGADTCLLTSRNNYDYYLLKMNLPNIPRNYAQLMVATCDKEYRLNDSIYTRSGKYQQLIPLGDCCDSVIMLDLTLYAMQEPVITIDTFVLGLRHSYVSYQWIKNGAPISGATQSTYKVTENANYQVAVSDSNGCTDTTSVYVVDNYSSAQIGFHDVNDIQIFPNPVTDMLYIKSMTPVSIKLTDMQGRLLRHQSSVGIIPVKNLPEGIYLLYIHDVNGRLIKVEKIIKSG